jgi:hypothetical protein
MGTRKWTHCSLIHKVTRRSADRVHIGGTPLPPPFGLPPPSLQPRRYQSHPLDVRGVARTVAARQSRTLSLVFLLKSENLGRCVCLWSPVRPPAHQICFSRARICSVCGAGSLFCRKWQPHCQSSAISPHHCHHHHNLLF